MRRMLLALPILLLSAVAGLFILPFLLLSAISQAAASRTKKEMVVQASAREAMPTVLQSFASILPRVPFTSP